MSKRKNSKKLQWETGVQINPICQINLNFRADGSTKVTLSPVLKGKWWWSKRYLVLEDFWACSLCHEDQGHADPHPGNSQNHIKHQVPTTHKCCTRLVLGWITRG